MRTSFGAAALSVVFLLAAGAKAQTPVEKTAKAPAKTPAAVKPVAKASQGAREGAGEGVGARGRTAPHRRRLRPRHDGLDGRPHRGAKAKIWSIANQMISAKPTPRLRIGLVGYRDRTDEYVTRRYDLTDDIDTIYGHLQRFQAGGGGDTPESVNQALHEAVHQMSWSPGRDALKIVFLVGDAPPHMDYQDDVKYQATCQAAVKKDLIVNTVQCGGMASTTPVWKEIASLAEGSFVAIGQTGDMQVVSTPMDEELSRLNREIGTTIVAYGSERERGAVMAKQAVAEAAPAAASADRLAYNAATSKVVQGGGDLVDDLNEGRAKLSDLSKDELPAELKGKTPEQQKAYLAQQEAKRKQLQAQVADLVKKRQAYVETEMKKAAAEGKGSAFDVEVARTLKEQAKRKKIAFGTTP
ncbi:MAG: VWA domain-containing protein [Holophagales bacterium]|nr:VWA domain-containing protein [Holophagales bacterium]